MILAAQQQQQLTTRWPNYKTVVWLAFVDVGYLAEGRVSATTPEVSLVCPQPEDGGETNKCHGRYVTIVTATNVEQVLPTTTETGLKQKHRLCSVFSGR